MPHEFAIGVVSIGIYHKSTQFHTDCWNQAPRVTRWRPGDRVFRLRPYTRGHGCYAEYAMFRDDQFAAAPDNFSDAELASVPLVGLTAWQGLFGEATSRHTDPAQVTQT